MVIPGEVITQAGEIELNVGRCTETLAVANTGDRPIQVGSHYHFFETNGALAFARNAARGMRLNIAAGTAVRFEPGQTRTVQLVALAGARKVFGFQGKVMGSLDGKVAAKATKSPATKPMSKVASKSKAMKSVAKKAAKK